MRKARVIHPGAIYHVTARANRKEFLLESALAKELLMEAFARARYKHDFQIDNFTIMGNHFHLLIRPQGASDLGSIMKWVLGIYSMSYNRIYQKWGHIWGARYYSRAIASFGEYLTVYQYIDLNPAKAGLVEDPSLWEWGGLWHHARGRKEIVSAEPRWRDLIALVAGKPRACLPRHSTQIPSTSITDNVDRWV